MIDSQTGRHEGLEVAAAAPSRQTGRATAYGTETTNAAHSEAPAPYAPTASGFPVQAFMTITIIPTGQDCVNPFSGENINR